MNMEIIQMVVLSVNLDSSIRKLKTGETLTIAALGDSLTQGWLVPKGYPDFLNEMLSNKYPDSQIKIYNKGIPGNTSEEGLYRLRHDVLDLNPDLVLIQFALNDAYLGYPPKKFQANIVAIIKNIKNSLSSEIIVLTSVPLLNAEENRMAEIFYKVLEEASVSEDVLLVKVHKYWGKKIALGINHKKLVQSDQVHPTVQGYKIMAEAIMQLF